MSAPGLVVTMLVLAACGGEPPAPAPPTPAELAVSHCRPAIEKAIAFESDLEFSDAMVSRCEAWYGSQASQVQLDALACMGTALGAVAWSACREPGAAAATEREPRRVAVRTRAVETALAKQDSKVSEARGSRVAMQKRELDQQIAENASVLGALRDGGELEGIFGSGGLDADIMGSIGGLIGAEGIDVGSGGLGSRGSGLGGGGTSEGLGGLGTRGHGGGASGYGTGGGSFGLPSPGDGPSVRVGDPIILGALDKSEIGAVIERHLNQLRYCYQRELVNEDDLAGKITVKFVIAEDGSVSSAATKRSTMNDSDVESCLNGRFMRMRFPEPEGGGIVVCTYPFIFTPG